MLRRVVSLSVGSAKLADQRQSMLNVNGILRSSFTTARSQSMPIAIVDFIVAPENCEGALGAILAEAPAVRAMKGNIAFQAYRDNVAFLEFVGETPTSYRRGLRGAREAGPKA